MTGHDRNCKKLNALAIEIKAINGAEVTTDEPTLPTESVTIQATAATDWNTDDAEILTNYEAECTAFGNSLGADTSICNRARTVYTNGISNVDSSALDTVDDMFSDINNIYGFGFSSSSQSKTGIAKGNTVLAYKAFIAANREGAANFAVQSSAFPQFAAGSCQSDFSPAFSSTLACVNAAYTKHYEFDKNFSTPVNHFTRQINAATTADSTTGLMILGAYVAGSLINNAFSTEEDAVCEETTETLSSKPQAQALSV